MKTINESQVNVTHVKALFTKVALAGLLAGAALLATPAKAHAQVAFGLRVGPAHVGVYTHGPVYYNPGPVYYAPRPVYSAPVYAAPAYGYYGAPAYRRGDWDHDRRDFDHRDWNHR